MRQERSAIQIEPLPGFVLPSFGDVDQITAVMIHLLDFFVGLMRNSNPQPVFASYHIGMVPIFACIALLVALSVAGCAFGRLGTLAERRTLTSNAEVIDVYGVGALFRLRGVDGGFTFGWRHATYIYPRHAQDGMQEGVRWTYGLLPRRGADPFFLAVCSIGAEVAKYPSMLVAHLGFRTDAFTFAARAEESRIVNFSYRPRHPGHTRLLMSSLPIIRLP